MSSGREDGPKVVMCSYGLRVHQITLETLAALRRADIVFGEALDRASAAPILPYCREFVLLNEDSPPPPTSKHDVHRVMRAKVRRIIEAVSGGRTAAVVTYGHPAFLCVFADFLAEECLAEGVAFQYLDAVSSLSSILALAGVRRLAPRGVRLYSACTLDLESVTFDPTAPTVVFDLYDLWGPKKEERRRGFCRLVCEAYRPEHPVELLRCSCEEQKSGLRREFTAAAIADVFDGSDLRAVTLHIPAVARPTDAPDWPRRGRRP